ncbi:hypothetical protein, partial [Pseudomonas sp. 2995-1]|uniref:hypothetical protein n=1 Tax=Pseudomonas sp. 2995-1 TaxID=1712679 RepID=UPI001C438044
VLWNCIENDMKNTLTPIGQGIEGRLDKRKKTGPVLDPAIFLIEIFIDNISFCLLFFLHFLSSVKPTI